MPQLLRFIQIIEFAIPLILLVFWAWMFWDMTHNRDLPGNEKLTWTIAFIFVSIFAALFYYVREYRNRY